MSVNPSEQVEYESSVNIQSFLIFLVAMTVGLLVRSFDPAILAAQYVILPRRRRTQGLLVSFTRHCFCILKFALAFHGARPGYHQ